MTVFVVHPSVRGGEPCIAGTDVALSDILRKMNAGVPPAKIRAAYPQIDVATWVRALCEIVDLGREQRDERRASGSEKRPREL
jgi:uncharacterized protein (DUF433 family)